VIAELAVGIRPVTIVRQGSGRISPSGTSFILGAGHRRILVSAEHVVDGPERKLFGVSPHGSTAWPDRYWRLAPAAGSAPEADVAWAAATITDEADEATAAAIRIEAVLPFFPFDEGASLVAVGYPASRGKIRNAQQTLSNQLMSVVCNASPETVYNDLALDSRVHFAMAYDPAACVGIDGQPIVGAKSKGMSGGPAFLVTAEPTGNGAQVIVPRLVGIMTEYHGPPHNVIVGVRIEHLLDGLEFWDDRPGALYIAEVV
jgi:hypothetical protein